MIATFGYIVLVLALVACTYSAIALLIGNRLGLPRISQSARNSLYATSGLVLLASLLLLYALLSHDFSIKYVAAYTSRAMSTVYTITAFWAGNSGSLLLWSLVLAVCSAILLWQQRSRETDSISYAGSTVLIVQAFFLVIVLFFANPFEQIDVIPADGNGLSPLLENPGMIFHPTTLITGYAGFTIPFALVIAALISKRLDKHFINDIRKWTLVFWVLLGAGNILGMQWAYVELGWGGYWAWDPVENAGLMPWLTATAFLHSLMLQRGRGILKTWNVSLIGITFFLSIFGTFLTRSDILSSVHTFGETKSGPLFLFFLCVCIATFITILIIRRNILKSQNQEISLISRESVIILSNLVLIATTVAILLGTIYPVLSEFVTGTRATVGPPFYNSVVVPMLVALVFTMGICPLIGWHRRLGRNLSRNILWAIVVATLLALTLIILGIIGIMPIDPYAIATFSMCAFVIAGIALEILQGTFSLHSNLGVNYVKAFSSLVIKNKSRYGGYIVHSGIVLMAMGIIGSSAYGVSKEFTLAPGESATINNYSLTYHGLDQEESATKIVMAANISIEKGNDQIGEITPKIIFKPNFNHVSEVALRSTPVEDLYVILMGWNDNAIAAFRVLINPLVQWIWIGGFVLLFGTCIAIWPERKKTSEFI